jgi:hypothetical protein
VATSVKMREEDKRRLDRLQGELQAMRGRRVSQQDLLSWLLTMGEGQKQSLGEDAAKPLSARERNVLMSLPMKSGKRSREEDIDGDLMREVR